MQNRLTKAVAELRERAAKLSDEDRAKLGRDMAVTFEEHFAYQQAQARAHATGRITADEAQVIYIALGEVGSTTNGGWAADTDLPTKVAVTLAMGELLGR